MSASKPNADVYAAQYVRELSALLSGVVVSSKQREMPLDEGMRTAVDMVRELEPSRGKVILIGNGASSAIASHQAADFLKAAGVRACAFNDAPLLTCLGNDLGYEHTFDYPIGLMAFPGDLLIAISSSGASPNILNGTAKAIEKGCRVWTLSGFKPANPLRGLGDLNFFVPSTSYGKVEVVHLALLHCVNDYLANR